MKQRTTSQIKFTFIDTVSFQMYLNEIRKDPETKPITQEEEVALFIQYKSETNSARKDRIRERILKTQLRLVVHLAKKAQRAHTSIEDMVNAGNIGLVKAFSSHRFDETLGFRFGTFASKYIINDMNIFLNEEIADIIQPANRARIQRVINKVLKEFAKLSDTEPSDIDVVDRYNEMKEPTDPVLTTSLYYEIHRSSQLFYSLDTPINHDAEDPWWSNIEGDGNLGTDHAVSVKENRSIILDTLKSLLTPKEAEVVIKTYGFGCEPKTLEQISEEMDYTRERIGQFLANALNKLKSEKQLMLEILCSKTDVSLV